MAISRTRFISFQALRWNRFDLQIVAIWWLTRERSITVVISTAKQKRYSSFPAGGRPRSIARSQSLKASLSLVIAKEAIQVQAISLVDRQRRKIEGRESLEQSSHNHGDIFAANRGPKSRKAEKSKSRGAELESVSKILVLLRLPIRSLSSLLLFPLLRLGSYCSPAPNRIRPHLASTNPIEGIHPCLSPPSSFLA